MSRFGDLMGGNKAISAPAPEPVVEPVVEEVSTEKDVVVFDFDNMSKRQLEDYGRKHGIELDRRHSKTRLLEELKDHLSNS